MVYNHKIAKIAVSTIIALAVLVSSSFYVWGGEYLCGFEGGIFAGEMPNKTLYDYKEMCFISGKPIELIGTVRIQRTAKNDYIDSTYNYRLENIKENATLTRTVVIRTTIKKSENGQEILQSALFRNPVERIKINNVDYTLRSYDISSTTIKDLKPAINYYAGNMWSRKVYNIGNNQGTVSVEATGSSYGYEQHWSLADSQIINYTIKADTKRGSSSDKWGGTAAVKISTSSTRRISYVENKPSTSSFRGGYLEQQFNKSTLNYEASLPEFDKNNISTDRMLKYSNSLKIENFPSQERLPMASINGIAGHWAEDQIRQVYSLGCFSVQRNNFSPQKLITRAEFISSLVNTVKEVPQNVLVKKTAARNATSRTTRAKAVIKSPFNDLTESNIYFNDINTAFQKGMLGNVFTGFLQPQNDITRAQAAEIIVNALGLYAIAPSPLAKTYFADDASIPARSRDAIYVASKIGILKPDSSNRILPHAKLTMSGAAVLLNELIKFMRDDINREYVEKIVKYY